MTKLIWDSIEQGKYETGVSNGVLYPSEGVGVVWNGLISVKETSIGGEMGSFYYDGILYRASALTKEFSANIQAFSAPREFAVCLGEREAAPGIVLTNQVRENFGLSYKTMQGEDDYKIHLVYNAQTTGPLRTYSSLTDVPAPNNFDWNIVATPERGSSHKPSAHYVLDSTLIDSDTMATLEGFLYGTDNVEPRLLSVEAIVDYIAYFQGVDVVEDSITGLADLVAGTVDLTRTSVPGLLRPLQNTRLTETVVDGLYGLE